MLPHRSDTSRGHLHPPTRPRLSLPPSATLSLSFSQTSVSGSPAAPPPGWFLPCDRLCRHFLGGACASSLSLPFLPSPRLCNYQDPLAAPLFPSYRSKMQRPLSTRQIFSPLPPLRHNDIPREIVARSGRLHDFWNFRSYDQEFLRWRCAREDHCVRWTRENSDRGRLARLRVKTPFRSVRVYSNEGFPRCFISRYLRDIGKLLVHFIAVITSRLNTVVEFNYEETSIL